MTTPAPPDDDYGLERGFIKLVGLRIEQASGDRVVLSCPVTPDLHPPVGLVLGGVYATLAETAPRRPRWPGGAPPSCGRWRSPTTRAG
jgi:acyl-coenzyme A thioesterase PaaI-like protein